MKKTIISIIIGCALLAGCAANSSKVEIENNAKQETKETVKEDVKEEVKKDKKKTAVLGIGEMVQSNGLNITLNAVGKVESEYEFIKPKEGHEFFKANITLENVTEEDMPISSLMMFKMVDDNGVKYDLAVVNGEGSLDGTIGAGRKMTGDFTCEVKKDVKLELEVKPNLLDTKIIVYKLR